MMIYNKEAKSNLWLFATLLVILSLSFVFAEYIVNRAGSATDAKAEDVSFIFNVAVNNSWITGATDVANVSQINFTFPASFTINSDANGSTGASNSSFGLTGQTVYWLNNTHMILNVSAEIAGGHGHFWVNVTPATPGQYNVSVQILNATGITQRNISIIVNDTTPPQTAFISHSAGQNISGASVFLNTTVTDNFGTFNGTVYFNITNGSAVLSLTRLASQMGTSYNATLDTTTLNDGIWNVTIYANDSAYPQAVGNINVTTVLRLTIDNTNPQVALSSPVSVIQNVSGNLLLNASVTDGTVASAVYFNITNGSGVVAITRSATLLPGGLSWNMTLDTTTLNDGFWNITVIANDSVNNMNITTIRQIRVDNTNLRTSFVGPASLASFSNVIANITINVSVQDDGSGIDSVYFNLTNGSAVVSLNRVPIRETGNGTTATYSQSFNITGINDGQWNITIFSNDSAGNINITTVRTVIIDSTNPAVTGITANGLNGLAIATGGVTQNASGTTVLNATVTVGDSNTSAVYFNITNGSGVVAITKVATRFGLGGWTHSLDTTALNDGYWNITAISNDSAANMNITTVIQIRVDNTAPTAISFNSLAVLGNFSNLLSNFTMNITVTDSGSGIHSVYFNLSNGTSTVSLTRIAVREAGNITTGTWANYSFSAMALNLSDGEWNITAVVNDSANSMNITAFRAIRIDSTSPTLISFQFNTTQETATYQNGTNVSGPIYVKINVTELNIKNVTFMVFNATAGVVNLTSLGSTVVQNLTVATDGVYSVNISVYDYSGHSNFTSSIGNFIVDRAAPILTLTKETSSSTTISYATAASDGGGSSVLSCAVASPTGTVDQTNKLITGLACGAAYSIVYNCTDYAGNVGTDTESFATDACTSNGGSGGGSSSSSSSSTSAATVWTSTIAEDEVEL